MLTVKALSNMSKLKHPDRPHNVPVYPGPPPRKPPEPPKYLVTTEDTEDGKKQQIKKVVGAPTRPKGVSQDPVMARVAKTTTSRDFTSPPNHFPKRIPYQVPSEMKVPSKKKPKDSSKDMKEVHRSSIVVEEQNQPYGKPLPLNSGVPKLPAIPKAFVPTSRKEYSHLPQMHQRGADGKYFGGKTRRYVPAEYVPYLEQQATTEDQNNTQYYDDTGQYDYAVTTYDQTADDNGYQVAIDKPVGPDNPMKQLSDTWCACWDDEAGAVYYYNHVTGEATWIMPDDVGASATY